MKNKLLTVIVSAGLLSIGVHADLSSFGGTAGFMNVFDINGTGDGPGGYQFGSGWGVADLKTVTSDDLTHQMFPNVNTYANSLVGVDGDRDYWTNSGDGGVTAGLDGNKWMQASTFRELTLGAGQTEASMDFNVSQFSLDSRYAIKAFIKTLDPNAGFATIEFDEIDINGTLGTTTLSINNLVEGHILQIGYQMDGINANPDTDWGSVTATLESASVIPEPATIAFVGIFGGAMLFLRRLRVY